MRSKQSVAVMRLQQWHMCRSMYVLLCVTSELLYKLHCRTYSTLCAGMDNYMMYSGTDGVYTHTEAYQKDESCPICSPGVPVTVSNGTTLLEVCLVELDLYSQDARLMDHI
jgi:hypothetical protein